MSHAPNDPGFANAARGASARRVRYTLLSLALIAVTTVLCAALVFIGETRRIRVDVTATRSHSLSPRIEALLDGLDSPHELVVVADSARLDTAAARRLSDFLDLLRRSSSNLTATWIDTSNPSDRAAFEDLPRRMLELRATEVTAGKAAIENARSGALRVAQSLDSMSVALGEWPGVMRDAGASPEMIDALGELAALARVRRDEVTSVAEAFPMAGVAIAGGIELPDVAAAQGSLGVVLRRAAESLDTITRAAAQVGAAAPYAPLHDRAGPVSETAQATRDEALRAADALAQAERVKLLDTLRLLQGRDAAVLLSENDVIAIRIESMLAENAAAQGASQAAQVRFEAERAITSALAAASTAAGGGPPLVVLTHSQPAPLLASAQPGQGDALAPLRGLLDHIAAQGFVIREWATSVDQQRPAFTEARSRGQPIVWVVLPGAASTTDGAARMGALAKAVDGLLTDGESVLMNVGPSLLPRVGEGDPLVASLRDLGLDIDSGRPLIETVRTPGGPRTKSDFRVLRANDEQAVGAAIDGLAIALIWPLPMTIDDSAPMEWTSLVSIPARDEVWGESQWPTLVQAGTMNAAASFDDRVDVRDGPWTVVAAGERFLEGADAPQRVVVVGSNGWFFDTIAQRSANVDGRIAMSNPGNLELFDASLLWLAGQDEVMARSAAALGGPRIAAIDPGTLRALWAFCILGPATATLLLGVAIRMFRG
jgi:hypothetical protein